jgi:hypothetical protein
VSKNKQTANLCTALLLCNRYMEFKFVLGVKVIWLIDRTELFKINNVVLGGETAITYLHSSLEV